MKLAKYLSYGAMAALILMMMAATFVEKISGTPVAFRWVYHNPVFLILWAVAAVGGLVFLFQRGVHRKLFTMGIHVGLVVILAGALVTYLSGTSGSIHLREGETSEVFELEDGTTATLPFGIGLDRFVIDYYPDSRMPSDYTSCVVFRPEGKAVCISMNHIAKYRGYRFYQADYDDDGKGSVLAVSHDPWGVGITYAGYLLLLVSMMGFFFEKQTPFRAALRRVASFTLAVAFFVLAPSLPAEARSAEVFYSSVARPWVPSVLCLSLGVVLFVLGAVFITRNKKYPARLLAAGTAVALLVWLYLTLVIGLRWYLSGTGPYVGRYSVMMLMAWLSTLAILLLHRRFPLIQPLGFLLSGFTMLLASRAGAGLQITPLMPVLRSPLLSFHVLSMMMSYTLFGLVTFNGIMGVTVPSRDAGEKIRDVSLVLLYPAVFLLAFGTFLGAVWANISWGRYWAWDPKETWALITLLVYSFTLHGNFRNARFFHAYTIAAFVCVLVTYFGVNLLLGGMHSYA